MANHLSKTAKLLGWPPSHVRKLPCSLMDIWPSMRASFRPWFMIIWGARAGGVPWKPKLLQPILLSSAQVNAAEDIPPKPRSDGETASFTAIKNFLKSWDGRTWVLVGPDAGFKKCCMRSGLFDGSRRNHFCQRIDSSLERGATSVAPLSG